MKESHALLNQAMQRNLPVPMMSFLDLKAQFATIQDELVPAILRVLESQHFILGAEVEAFEKEVASATCCKYAVGCASGSDALILALLALEIGRGDEVITTPFTFVASAGAIARVGAKPVFVDIDPATQNISPAEVERCVASHPSVAECAVIGVPDPRWVQSVKAIVVLRDRPWTVRAYYAVWSRLPAVFLCKERKASA